MKSRRGCGKKLAGGTFFRILTFDDKDSIISSFCDSRVSMTCESKRLEVVLYPCCAARRLGDEERDPS